MTLSRFARRLVLCVALLGVSLLHARGGLAQSAADVAAARELFKEAAELIKKGRWEEGRERLERSLMLKQAPITHFSLAVAQRKTGQLVEALESFRAFLASPAEKATDRYRAPAEQAVRALEPRVAKVSLLIRPKDPPELAVTIDGVEVPVAALDQMRLVNPGGHVLQVIARGFREATHSFQVGEGETVSLVVALEPAARADPSTATAVVTADGAAVDGSEHAGQDEADDAGFPTVPVALMAGGTAAFGVGLALGLIGLSEARDTPTNDSAEADAARTKGVIGDVVAGVGIAAVAVGGILLIVRALGDDGGDEASDAGVHVAPWASGPLAGVELRF